nr:ribonuclease H-like domain-containing protein [Tanacetum cinerariifolium]
DKFDVEKEGEEKPEFEGRKPEFEVNVSPSSSAQSKKLDDKTKREAKGKSLVESLIGYRNLSVEFEDFIDNNINEDNVADTSQLPDDPNMPELEDITYSDDEDNVGVEADFNNLETTITVNLIPTTRVHKDHPMTQIISDLSSATQTRSMTRMSRDQDVKSAFLYGTIKEEVYVCQPTGFEDPDYPDKIVQICLWIIDSGCLKHMTSNRALLTNFVEKFLKTVRFGNNDFVVIAGYGDVVENY